MHRATRPLRAFSAAIVATAALGVSSAHAGVFQVFGDMDVLGTGTYESDPTAGTSLFGLGPGEVTASGLNTEHSFGFDPEKDDYAGTDQIFVGEVQTAMHDGYSGYAGRRNGPQVINLDYTKLIPKGSKVATVTLGIAADDFQNEVFGQAYTAKINGVEFQALTDVLNGLDQTGPVVDFFTIGLPLGVLRNTGMLTIEISQGGDGGDGWAIDFLTVGVTFVPAPGATALGLMSLAAMGRRRR